MKRILFALLIFCGAMLAAAEFTVVKNVPFLGKERAEKLDLYLPADGKPHPTVVMIHGGSWRAGAKDAKREINICTNLAKNGFVAASIEYKLAKKGKAAYPINLNDCRDAVRFLRANAAKYQIDADHIGVIGASAGGHLALLLTLTPQEFFTDAASPYPGVSCQVQCCINLYGVTTRLPAETQLNYDFDVMAGDSPEEKLPVKLVRKDMPPVLTIHGTGDKTVNFRHAEALDAALKASGAKSEMILLPGVDHAFYMEFDKDGKPLPKVVKIAMLRFLNENLR